MSIYNAVSIPFFGDPHVLRIEQFALPSLDKNQLLINVAAASVNPIDCKTRAGLGWAAEANKDNLPWVLGYDMAGMVTAVGDEANEHLIGKYVCGMIGFPTKGGAYSQCTVVTLDEVIVLPESVSLTQAAALPLAGLTAYQALVDHGGLAQLAEGRSPKVLVLGATGGVGHIAAQIAKAYDADVTVTGKVDKQATLNHVLEEVNWAGLEQLGEQSFDIVIDCIGGDLAVDVINRLTTIGTWITLPTITAEQVKQAAEAKSAKCINFLVQPNLEQLKQLLDLAEQNKLTIHVDKVLAFTDVALAHAAIEERSVTGKVLLSLD